MRLLNPIAYVAPVNTHFERSVREGQEVPIAGITVDKPRWFLTHLRFQPLGHLERVIAHRFDIQGENQAAENPGGHRGSCRRTPERTTWLPYRAAPGRPTRSAASPGGEMMRSCAVCSRNAPAADWRTEMCQTRCETSGSRGP